MKTPGANLSSAESTVVGATQFAARARTRREATGIEVHEEDLGNITAQRLYKMRCGCGRSWFELQLPRLMACPACSKLGLVSL